MSEQSINTLRAPQLPEVVRTIERREIPGDSAPVIRIQRSIFDEAGALEASDVHIEPRSTMTCVRYRINGLMKDGPEIPRWMHDSLVARIKILANLDISERRVPQDGHIAATGNGPDIRVSVLPSKNGEKIVLRLLRQNRSAKTLSDLGLSGELEDTLRALIHRPQGIVLVVGPTGSGKTTTLYAMVHEVCQEPLNIVTIEDPVEYELERITQVQVHEKAGLTFARALRAILRQDPDIILVGEIRDGETAKIAFDAAMTGHLVLSTAHTTDSVSALSRLVELGVKREVIASGTAAIIAQRLVRQNCPTCSETDAPGPIYLKRLGIPASSNADFRRGGGCACCNFSGVSGRAGLYEVTEINTLIRGALMKGSEPDIRRALRESGVRTLTDQAVSSAVGGAISVAEAYRTCYFGEGADG